LGGGGFAVAQVAFAVFFECSDAIPQHIFFAFNKFQQHFCSEDGDVHPGFIV